MIRLLFASIALLFVACDADNARDPNPCPIADPVGPSASEDTLGPCAAEQQGKACSYSEPACENPTSDLRSATYVCTEGTWVLDHEDYDSACPPAGG